MSAPAAIAPALAPLLRACPACGGTARRDLPAYSRDHWVVAECAACSFVYLVNPPETVALEEDFAWEKTIRAEETRRKKDAPVMYGLDYASRLRTRLFRGDEAARYLRWFGAGAKVLDVGCGDGSRLRAPLVPFGIEISRGLAEKADAAMRPLGGYCLQGSTLETIGRFPAGQFDAIVMRSYLEHETEPREVLNAAHRALKPGGRIYVKVPNYGSVNRRLTGRSWCGFRHPDHVNYFTLKSLTRMAQATRYRLRLLNPLNLAFDDNIHAHLVAV
ncbi:MAG: class I SAM-dependent methyltransferase [Pseudomonadota bacterium]